MHLQTQRMANPVRHKRPGQVILHHRLFAHVGNQLVFTQQLRDTLMELDMVINVTGTGLHGTNQRLLLIVNVFDQMGKVVIAVRRPSARQICGIAVIFRTGVEQETAHLRRGTMVQFGVVQDGGMLIQRDNIAVRHVGITMAGGGEIGLVDIEFAHSRLESFVGRTMTIHRRLLRFTHAGQLVIGFVSPVVMQVVDNPFRVDLIRGDTQAQRALRHRTDIANITASSRQLAADAIGLR